MNPAPDPAQVANLVTALAFFLGMAFGSVAQATRFCTMGAITDVMTYGNTDRLRALLMAIATAIVVTQFLIAFEVLDLSSSIYTVPRLLWASCLFGGLVFGGGMVLASGCTSKALIRAGSGNLKAVAVLLIAGFVGQMTLRGLLAGPRVNLLDALSMPLSVHQDLPSWIGSFIAISPRTIRMILGASIPAALLLWIARDRSFVRSRDFLGAIVIGLVVCGGWYVTARIGFIAEHPDNLEPAWVATNSHRPESLSFIAPLAFGMELLSLWSDANTRLTFGVAAAIGVLVGAFLSAWRRHDLRWETFPSVEDTANHFVGAAMMGFGGVTALGCTIGEGISGLSTLAANSMLAVAGIVAGAVLAVRYQMWRLDREIESP
ncbi:MAG: YeeE/YedE family protein [Burkholderiaceae bacterium]